MPVKSIPDGYYTVTPHLTLSNASKAIEFYKKAFGAEETARMPGPGGKIMHAEVQIGNSRIMLNDEFPDMGGNKSASTIGASPVTLHIYVEDVDKFFNQAVAAGAKVEMPPQDMFWGDRYGKLKDPYGHQWSVATHLEDLTPEEMGKRAAQAFPGGGS